MTANDLVYWSARARLKELENELRDITAARGPQMPLPIHESLVKLCNQKIPEVAASIERLGKDPQPEQESQAFWVVWNPAGRSPQLRHQTEEAAVAEAHRLADTNRGEKFYVLQAKTVSERCVMTTRVLIAPRQPAESREFDPSHPAYEAVTGTADPFTDDDE